MEQDDHPTSIPQSATTPTFAMQQDYSPTSIPQSVPVDIPTSPVISSWIGALALNAEPMTIVNTVISILSFLLALYAVLRKPQPPPTNTPPAQDLQPIQLAQPPQAPSESRSTLLERAIQASEGNIKSIEDVIQSVQGQGIVVPDRILNLLTTATEAAEM